MDKSYKARKEDFVSNLSGGDLWEINLVTLVASSAVLLWSALQSRQSFFTPYEPLSAVIDFLLNVGGILFAITAYSSAPLLLNILLISPAVLITLLSKPNGPSKKPAKPPQAKDVAGGSSPTTASSSSSSIPIRPFLTVYRGSMLIVTCIAILAVDFRIFPRRFAKVENWGTSLMDLGVGSFVFSAGVVSARAILTTSSKQQKKPLLARLTIATRHSIPLLVLGLIRLYSVKGLDYAEHVTEYGVHWNFFFTLGFLPPFVEIFHSITTTVIPSYDVLAVLLTVAYEAVLDNTGLKAYILISPRGDSLLSKNREGIFSFIGYLAIFLCGRGAGLIVLPDQTNSSGQKLSPKMQRRALIKSLFIRSTIWWALYFVSTHPYIPIPPIPQSWANIPVLDIGLGISVSRRLANLPYVLWITAFNTFQILLFCCIETYYFPSVQTSSSQQGSSSASKTADDASKSNTASEIERATPRIMQVFNKNGLFIFLIANLLTGLVNLTMNTLDMKPLVSMGVLLAYSLAVTGGAIGMDLSGIRIKL